MFVSIYYKPSLFNAHTMIFIVHIFMNVNKLCLKQRSCNCDYGVCAMQDGGDRERSRPGLAARSHGPISTGPCS